MSRRFQWLDGCPRLGKVYAVGGGLKRLESRAGGMLRRARANNSILTSIAAAAFGLTVVFGSWADDDTSLGVAAPLLFFTPAATAITAVLAFLVRQLR